MGRLSADEKLLREIRQEERYQKHRRQTKMSLRVCFVNDDLESIFGNGLLAEAACHWLRSVERKHSLAQRLHYAKDARVFIKYFDRVGLENITSGGLTEYFRKKQPYASDIRDYHKQAVDIKHVAKAIMGECQRRGWIRSNPATYVRRSKAGSNHRRRSDYQHMFSDTEIGRAIVACLDEMFPDLSLSTFENYVTKMRIVDKHFKKNKFAEIKYRDLKHFVRLQQRKRSNKTINELLILVRKIFHHAMEEEIIEKNPALNLKNLRITRNDPDPFTTEEINTLVKCCEGYQSELSLFLVGVYTGMRISELLALAWEDIDLSRRRIHVRRANVKGFYKTPKTRGSNRVIDMTSQCHEVLENLYALTGSHKPASYNVTREDNLTPDRQRLRLVFLNSRTGSEIRNDSHLTKYFWTPLLLKSGIRRRGINNCRHTFASQMLSIGQPKGWIANQLGHSSYAMLDAHYGKWMINESPDYVQKASEHFSRMLGSTDIP